MVRWPLVDDESGSLVAEIVEAVMRDLTGETAIDKGVGEDERTDDAGGLVLVWQTDKQREREGGGEGERKREREREVEAELCLFL